MKSFKSTFLQDEAEQTQVRMASCLRAGMQDNPVLENQLAVSMSVGHRSGARPLDILLCVALPQIRTLSHLESRDLSNPALLLIAEFADPRTYVKAFSLPTT